MGEASRRKAEIVALKAQNENWLASLSGDEKTVATVALATYTKIVETLGMTEGCYNLAFFLYEHLRRKYGISVRVVVGWINDGEWDGAASHAWVEYQGKKIDISMHKTSHPDAQPPGDLIILDYLFRRGKATYTYSETLSESAAKELDKMRSNPTYAPVIAHKQMEHNLMLARSASQEGVNEYFANAPLSNKYESLARLVG
ncbi:MAG: lasso peptide biosynthesis protein [Sideroxydans sp.]|nr:lasso peptide biosynthesis protein [Sideroxydans sp.]MDD5056597.1 lasso peptide biosynthesis protein [Sideroxydans sp.]